jgi:CBS domain-containing protein
MEAETVWQSTDDPSHSAGRRCPIPVLVRDVMSANPMTARPADSIHEVVEVMLKNGLHCLPVVDAQEHLVGIVSVADIVNREFSDPTPRQHLARIRKRNGGGHRRYRRGQFRRSALTVSAIMTSDVIVGSPAEPVAMATKRMVRHDVRGLPVVKDGKVVGWLSERDVLSLFHRPDSEIRESLDVLSSDPLWMPAAHAVVPTVSEGVVTLGGTVLHPSDMAKVIGTVGQIPGVVGVVNRLTWREPDPHPPRSPDTETVSLAKALVPPIDP